MASSIYDNLRAGVTTASADATRALATELAGALPPDTTLALHGDLGVGKTTFVQGLAHGFGVSEAVTSPTFTIYTIHHGRPALRSLGEAGRLFAAKKKIATKKHKRRKKASGELDL